MPKYTWFNVSLRQYQFLKILNEFEDYDNCSKVFLKAMNIIIKQDFQETFKGLIKKGFIEIRGGIPDFSSQYVAPSHKLTAYNIKQIIDRDLEIRINPNARDFMKILDIWFNKRTWTRKPR